MTAPALSVVVVTPTRFAQIRRTVRHLREQAVADRIELVLVVPEPAALDDARPGELDGFARVVPVGVGPIPNVDRAAAAGVHAATAEVVALVEDHAFPQPGWAEAIMKAHVDEPAAVGSVILNANPERALSWTNLLIAYGPWTDASGAGAVDALPGHNITYRRERLVPYGDRLRDRLGRDGGLLEELAASGGRLRFEGGARIAHVNPSVWRATIALRWSAGRLYGSMRAADAGWSRAKRLVYVAGGPLIPLVRFVRLCRDYFAGGRRSELVPRVLPALFAGLVLDGLGQMAGYAAGPGGTVARLATFEMDRLQHIPAGERDAVRE